MKIIFTARLSTASTKTVRFWFTKFTKRKTHKSILLRETFSLTEGFIRERFSHFSNSRFLKQATKTLSVRKYLTENTNLGQTSRLNLDKFGTGNDVPVIAGRHCSQTIGLMA